MENLRLWFSSRQYLLPFLAISAALGVLQQLILALLGPLNSHIVLQTFTIVSSTLLAAVMLLALLKISQTYCLSRILKCSIVRSPALLTVNQTEKINELAKIIEQLQEKNCSQQAFMQAIQAKYQHMAHHDPLTGLANRALFDNLAADMLLQAQRCNIRSALIFIDLDQFKPINDTYGHSIGDQLLQQAALRLTQSVRASDTVVRLGGDEFVVLLPHIECEQDAQRVAQKILHNLNATFEINQKHLQIGASVGIAIYPEHGNEASCLLKHADFAMYQAKKSGFNRIHFYTPQTPI